MQAVVYQRHPHLKIKRIPNGRRDLVFQEIKNKIFAWGTINTFLNSSVLFMRLKLPGGIDRIPREALLNPSGIETSREFESKTLSRVSTYRWQLNTGMGGGIERSRVCGNPRFYLQDLAERSGVFRLRSIAVDLIRGSGF